MTTKYPLRNSDKSLCELRDEIKDLSRNIEKSNNTSEKLSKVLLIVAVLQFFVALTQLFISLIGPLDKWLVALVEILIGLACVVIFNSLSNALGLKKDLKK